MVFGCMLRCCDAMPVLILRIPTSIREGCEETMRRSGDDEDGPAFMYLRECWRDDAGTGRVRCKSKGESNEEDKVKV